MEDVIKMNPIAGIFLSNWMFYFRSLSLSDVFLAFRLALALILMLIVVLDEELLLNKIIGFLNIS